MQLTRMKTKSFEHPMVKVRLDQSAQDWIEARKRHRLSHAEVQMARELGMNPKRLGKIDNHHQEPWKMPLQAFIGHLYFKRFGRNRPDNVLSIEDKAKRDAEKKAVKREAKLLKKQAKLAEEAAGEAASSAPAPSDLHG
jgi:hypothetical protein